MEGIKLESLPELKGSVEQITWANDIRNRVVEKINQQISPDKLSQEQDGIEHERACGYVETICHHFSIRMSQEFLARYEKAEQEYDIRRAEVSRGEKHYFTKIHRIRDSIFDRMYYEMAQEVIPMCTDAWFWIEWLKQA